MRGCNVKVWHGSRWELLYANLCWGQLHKPPKELESWSPAVFRERFWELTTTAGAMFHKDRAKAEHLSTTWVEVEHNNIYYTVMFEAMVDSNCKVSIPGCCESSCWAQPTGTYRLLALWVCGRHISEVLAKGCTIGPPWKPKHEVPPDFA